MSTWFALLMGLNVGGMDLQNPEIQGCLEIGKALEAAYQGQSYSSDLVKSEGRVVTLLDHEKNPEIPDFICAGPIHVAASGIKIIGQGDVLIKLQDHANAPLVVVGPLKSYNGDEYWQLSDEERKAFRVKQVHIENLRLDGNRLKQDHECWTSEKCDDWEKPLSAIRNNGVTVRYSEYVTLLNIRVKGTISGGFVAERYSNNLLVDGYESNDNFFDGFTAYQTYDSVFKNLELHDNLAAGISLDLDVRGVTFMNVKVYNAGDVGLFARATHQNYFKNILIENPGSHGIFLARHGEQPPAQEGQIPWDTVTENTFEDLTVRNSRRGAGIRINDKECVKNRLTRYSFVNNASGDISLAEEGMLIIDDQRYQVVNQEELDI